MEQDSALGYADEILTLTKTKVKKGIPRILDFADGKDAKPHYIDVTPANFPKYFNKEIYSFEELAAEMLALKDALIKENVAASVTKTSATNAIRSLLNDDDTIREEQIDFFSNSRAGSKYTRADDDFIFSRLYKDSENNLYMRLKDDQLFRLEIKPNTERTLLGNTLDVNTQFWPAFFATFDKNFEMWRNKINEEIQKFDFENEQKSIEEILMEAGIPRIFLECHKLTICLRGIKTEHGTKWKFDHCTLSLNSAGAKNYNYANLIRVFSENLIQAVDVGRVKEIPLFSNNENEISIKHLTIPNVTPGISKNSPPRLPKMWEKFLGGERFFDPVMDKLKIATFVSNILTANYSGRQILVIGGEGEDGKGVFLNVLSKIIGSEYAASVNATAFTPEDSFGLQNVVNKKFIYLSDCRSVSKLFSQDKFKALSGGDVIPINRKNLKIMNWKPQGLCIAIATNNNFYVNSEHGRSRALPLVFRKNFNKKEMIDKREMEVALLAEKDAFIQWCIDFKYYMNNILSQGKLFRGNSLLVCTDEALKNVIKEDEEKIEVFELFKGFCEKQLLNGEKFCNWNERTEAEEEDQVNCNEIFDKIFDQIKNKIERIENVLNKDDNLNKFTTPLLLLTEMNNYISTSHSTQNLLKSVGLQPNMIGIRTKVFVNWYSEKFEIARNVFRNYKLYKVLIEIGEKENENENSNIVPASQIKDVFEDI